MTAKDAVVIADVASELGTVATALLIARLTDITSDIFNASMGGADIGRKTNGRRKEQTMRLIDADALMDRMYHDAFETDTDMQKWDSGCWIRYKMFEIAIDNAPTIEPKRGEWIVYNKEKPQKVGSYLVTHTADSGRYYVDYDYWTVCDKFKYHPTDVVAWMPFPEPYEQQTDCPWK